ncbi:unnamed protein product [Ixodes persulcatus]
MRMPFWSPDDERLSWLQGDCLAYFASWKASTTYKMEFLSTETYEALRVTTTSTVLCTRHLLNSGFHFVLTSKYSSDDVESLFSTIRQLNGSNDKTDAYSALSALQKILVTGILHSSTSANVGSVVGPFRHASKLPPLPVERPTASQDLGKLLLPHLAVLEQYPCMLYPYILLRYAFLLILPARLLCCYRMSRYRSSTTFCFAMLLFLFSQCCYRMSTYVSSF